MTTIRISDLYSDCPIILEENGKYYQLKLKDVTLDGFTEAPVQIFLKKGDRIYKKNLHDVK